MSGFKNYKRTQIAEMREVTESDISFFAKEGKLLCAELGEHKVPNKVSISDADLQNGSPKIGDMIARNPKNNSDQWLVAKQYFKDNFGEVKMDFGEAIRAAKKGKKVARIGWNGVGMFAYIVPANTYPAQTDIAMKAFPDGKVPYREYWALKTAQNDIATWAPSGSDSLAEDWCIVE